MSNKGRHKKIMPEFNRRSTNLVDSQIRKWEIWHSGINFNSISNNLFLLKSKLWQKNIILPSV